MNVKTYKHHHYMKQFYIGIILFFTVQGLFGQSTSNLNVYVADKVPIKSGLFGVNNDWKFITDQQFPSFASTFNSLDLGVLRYPGGWESEWVDWDTNTAPDWPDGPSTPGASIATVKSNYSNYSVVVPTRPALNQTYNSQAWNNAVDQLKLEAENAIEMAGAENIKYVEIGNEWWLQYAGGVSRSNKLINYSKTAMKIAGYLASVYPERTFNILINGDFTVPSEFSVMKENFTEAYEEIDGLALHTYTGYQPPADKIDFGIETLGEKIDACARNFNQNKDLIIYCSEWMAARDYNEGRVYMEAANIIPDIIHIYSRHGVDAAAYWPPVNSTAPGVGLVNWNASVIYPVGQIMSDMASSFTGDVVRTTSDSNIGVTGALNNSQNLVLYITGKDNSWTNLNVNVHNFSISEVANVVKFRPNDYSQPDKPAAYVTESASVTQASSSSISLEINKTGGYEIFKIELAGSFIESEETQLIDFESQVSVETNFGATFEVVDNPDKGGLNASEKCGKLGRTSANWYELADIPCNFSIPANEYRYIHVLVNYPAQPDLILRLNQSGNEGNVRSQNSYVDVGEWKDIVFEYYGGENGIDVSYLRLLGDCGFENDPSGYVLNNPDAFGYFDEIIISQNPAPRSVPTSIKSFRQEENYKIYSNNQSIYFQADKEMDVWIYNLSGSLIKKYSQSSFNYRVPVPGLYILRVGMTIKKVIVR